VEEKVANRGSVRIDPEVMDLIVDEQSKLRKERQGKKPSYSEVIRLMWQSYSAKPSEKPGTNEITTSSLPYSPENVSWHYLLEDILVSASADRRGIVENVLRGLASAEALRAAESGRNPSTISLTGGSQAVDGARKGNPKPSKSASGPRKKSA
jgi:hypothetical protein